MRTAALSLCFFWWCLLLLACQTNQGNLSDKKPEQITAAYTISDSIKPGVLASKVLINNDVLNSFAIYLPKKYHRNITWPVLYFFDSGGNGALPIIKYKSLADSLGFIFIGSNVSKNGQAFDASIEIWKYLKNMSLQNFSIDNKRMYVAGFSGGARVSCALASYDHQISGVIANSAGTQNLEQMLQQQAVFIGISGTGDMNRAEMINIENFLNGSTLTHYYLEFEGIHEWCSIPIMKKALLLLNLKSYSLNPDLANSYFIELFIHDETQIIDHLLKSERYLDAVNEIQILQKSTQMFSNYSSQYNTDTLVSNPMYIKQKNELLKINETEIQLQQELGNILTKNTTLNTWQSKIIILKKQSEEKTPYAPMYKRVLGYASLMCYSLSTRCIVAKDYKTAEFYTSCYQIADPKNAEVYFFKALISGSQLDTLSTIQNLKNAVDLDLNNKNRIRDQVEFTFLQQNSAYKKLLKEIEF